jgi:hypothetical protein
MRANFDGKDGSQSSQRIRPREEKLKKNPHPQKASVGHPNAAQSRSTMVHNPLECAQGKQEGLCRGV